MSPCIGQDTHAHRYIHPPTTAGRVNVTGYNVIPADHPQQLWNDKVPLNIERPGLAEWVDWSLLLIGLKLPIRWTTECNGMSAMARFQLMTLVSEIYQFMWECAIAKVQIRYLRYTLLTLRAFLLILNFSQHKTPDYSIGSNKVNQQIRRTFGIKIICPLRLRKF